MFDDQIGGVVIAGLRTGVRLSRIGMPQLGYPTLIEVNAGPFVGSVRDEAVYDYGRFGEQLGAIYVQLSGAAKLNGDVFNLALAGDGLGHIRVSVVVVADCVQPESIRLAFEFEVDQTCLPAIISSVGREFLDFMHKS